MTPGSLFTLKTECITGLLKSVSTNNVFLPRLANVIARLATVVVLPSPGPALEIRIDLISFVFDSRIFVRSPRYDSEIGDFGLSLVMIFLFYTFLSTQGCKCFIFQIFICNPCELTLPIAGITPITLLSYFSISSIVLMVLSTNSIKKTITKAKPIPKKQKVIISL